MSRRYIGKRKRGHLYVRTAPQKRRTVAQQALTVARKVDKKQKKMVDLLVKEGNIAGTLANASSVTYLCDINPMIGYDVLLKSVRLQGWIRIDPTQASTALSDYRVDVILDRDPAKTALTTNMYLGSGTPTIYDMKLFAVKERFKVLASVSGHLHINAPISRKVSVYKKLNLKCQTAVVTDLDQANVVRNALYIAVWSTDAATLPTYAIDWRVVYQDS